MPAATPAARRLERLRRPDSTAGPEALSRSRSACAGLRPGPPPAGERSDQQGSGVRQLRPPPDKVNEIDEWSRCHRRLALGSVGVVGVAGALGVVGAVLVVLWLLAGAPWWPLPVLLAGAGLGRLLGRIAPRTPLYRLVGTGLVAGLIAVVVVAPQLTAAELILAAGGALARIPVRPGRTMGRDTRSRSWLAAAVALLLAGIAGLAVQHLHDEQRRAADDAQASAYSWAALLPRSPAQATHTLLAASPVATPPSAPSRSAQRRRGSHPLHLHSTSSSNSQFLVRRV
jgi:hypothetical protein